MSFTFLLGILACCISGFVSINRFGFAIEGALCSLERIFFDSKFGQLKTDEPKWKGFDNVKTIIDNLTEFSNILDLISFNGETKYINKDDEEISDEIEYAEINKFKYTKMFHAYKYLKYNDFKAQLNDFGSNFNDYINDFEKLNEKDKFIDKCRHYGNILKDCMMILAMVYYCFLLIVVTFACISMMFYACLKRQGYLLIFMHVLWNIIRFFMFSFFIFGAAYGMFSKALRDSVAIISSFFEKDNLGTDIDELPIRKNKFLGKCIGQKDYNFKDELDRNKKEISSSLEIFFTNLNEFKNMELTSEWNTPISEISNILGNTPEKHLNCTYLITIAKEKGGLFGSFNCGFLGGYLQLVYTTIYDASVEAKKLSATTLSAAFFGAVAIYFYLLVLHHYNNELFFDSGKSIFTSFDGFGGGYRKKNPQQDPAYKKRKLRAEIELTSKNDEASNYKDVNKNEEEDD